MENNFIIEVNNLSKHYTVETGGFLQRKRIFKAVNNLSLKIPRGCTLGLVGESGCGKTTLGQMICGLLKETSGEILFNGNDLKSLSSKERKEELLKIQMIFQDPYSSLNPKKKIGWILEEPLKVHRKLSKDQRRSLVKDMLETVGLDDSYMDSYPDELSGGQRQRISIAAALILDPEFVVADEAVSALDVSIQAQVLNLLRELQEKRGLTYLFISHDLSVVEYMSDYIAVMYHGKLVEAGTAEEIYNLPLHPYTDILLSSVPKAYDEEDKKSFIKDKKAYINEHKTGETGKFTFVSPTHAVNASFT